MVWLTISSIILTYLVYFLCNKWKNLPPGPMGLPIFGYLPFLANDVHNQFVELGKKYGKVFSLKLGTQTLVVLNTEDVIKEGFCKPEILGRPPHNAFAILNRESPFFVSGNDVWSEHRKFMVNTMKDLGLGKSKIESLMQEEIDTFTEMLRSHNGEPVDVGVPLGPSVSNNICALVFNERYDYDNPEIKRLLFNLSFASKTIHEARAVTYFPWLRNVPFIHKFFKIEEGRKASLQSTAILRNKVKQHEDTFDPKNIRDFIDCYLAEWQERKEKDPNTTFSAIRLVGSVADLFGAGSITVRISVLWLVYVIAAFPEVQKKVQKEIDEYIGRERSPEYKDLKELPFTQAVLLEVARWKMNVPIPFYRCCTKDTTLRGYNIPKGAIVVGNLWNVHHNNISWSEPEVFRPERFLSEDGLSIQKSPHFMPFSVGKRGCPGEKMANMEVYLYFATILQKFEVSFPEGFEPTYEATHTLFYSLKPYKVHLKPRY